MTITLERPASKRLVPTSSQSRTRRPGVLTIVREAVAGARASATATPSASVAIAARFAERV